MEYGLCVVRLESDLTKSLTLGMGGPAASQQDSAHPCQAAKQATNRRKATLNERLIDRYEKQTNVRQETARELRISLGAAGISYRQQMLDLALQIEHDRLTRSA